MKVTPDIALPFYPRTTLLPYKPNGTKDDLVASESEAAVIFETHHLFVEEKLDGASVGFSVLDDSGRRPARHPVIRSRDRILSKGSTKGEFAPIWTWFYKSRDRFEAAIGDEPYSIYGEWMLLQHGIFYDSLPDWFIAYDIYNYRNGKFLAPELAREILEAAGFSVPVLRFSGHLQGGYSDLEEMAYLSAAWANEQAEGIYLKISNPMIITHRFKMVRPDFRRGVLWDKKARNALKSKS